MIKIITFLGDRGPLETTYFFNGKLYTGGVFAEALHKFCLYDTMLVCVTEEAKENTWPHLEKLNDSRIKPIDIPIGRNNEEMWETFKIITEHINEKDTVIFDITHGLRSLPFLSFLFAAYLKTAKNVTIDAIYYGALDLRDRATKGPAPVIDLSEFISMIDWITATDQFLQTGDARKLAGLLNPTHQSSNVTKKAANTLSDISLATLLCQPFELSKTAKNLEKSLLKAQNDLENSVPPFEMLRQKITNTFNDFVSDPESDIKKSLKSQFKLIKWYQENNRIREAITLSREWLITMVSYRLSVPFTLNVRKRELITKAISGIEMVDRGALLPEELNEYGRIIFDSWNKQDKKNIIQLWNVLQPVRNTLDHAGHQEGAMSLKTIVKKAEDNITPLLDDLAKSWDIALSSSENNVNPKHDRTS
ncbi:TIGR02221 family CRISPR-associated protein [Spirulina major]|uniref:TIGR02221 family CRISPR-associated protein n=1 Tax=Spirulina major TaxID=270636 RepID=UPI000934DE60|nr:TIGR02221 family CRISPR-associated protein [Spirulina major]